ARAFAMLPRLFFPLGILLAGAGVVPWLLFATGVIQTWPALPHALTMAQGFYSAVAVGFLAGQTALGTPALALLAAGIGAGALAALAGAVVEAEILYIAVLAGLLAVTASRLRALPPSFVHLPIAAAAGIAGAALLIAGADGRALVSQGVMLELVLCAAPVLT